MYNHRHFLQSAITYFINHFQNELKSIFFAKSKIYTSFHLFLFIRCQSRPTFLILFLFTLIVTSCLFCDTWLLLFLRQQQLKSFSYVNASVPIKF